MLRKKLLIITFALVGALISSPVLANNCPSASPSGEGCLAGTYYCSGGCRSGLSWCPTWSPSPTCASGLDCSNCSGADSCGVCNACNSGYRLCGAYPDSFCKANGTLPANCASYNTNCDACASCVAGYTLNAGACVPATLKLGSSSVSGTNVVQGGVDSSLFVSGNKVGIGISAPTANLQLNATNNTEGLRIITSNYSPFIIRNSTDTADLFRIDQDGNITSLGNMSGSNTYWNFSGSSLFASSTTWNVGIGTTNATDKLTVVGGINSNSIINGLSLCINGDCKTSWGDAGWAFDGNTVGQTKSFGTLDNYSIPFLTNGVERMRLTNTGNLVIGTSTTGVRLHVESTQGAVAFFKSKLNGGSYAGYIGNGQTFSGEEFGLYYADGVYDNRLAVYNLNNSLFLYGGHLSSDASLAINNNTGNVGIGTTNPTQRLEIGGNVLLQAGNILYFRDNTSYINEASGLNIVAGDTRSLNLAGGSGTDLTITSAGNVGIGTTNPLAKLDVMGVISSDEVILHTAASQNVNTRYGSQALLSQSSIYQWSTAFGNKALVSQTTGTGNAAFGKEAGQSITTGYGNMAIGSESLRNATTNSSRNTAVGENAVAGSGAINDNVGIGNNALNYANASRNTFIGSAAGKYIVDGSNFTSGNDNTGLGYNVRPSSIGVSNEIIIGSGAQGIGSNSVVLGNNSILTTALKGNVGIGTTTPGTYRLSVDGTTRLNGAVTTSLSGSGNRCVYVDASGNLLAKGVDCGTATGGDNMGDHSATQNVKLNSYWLSGDGGNEGVFVDSSGGVGVGTNSITAGLRLSVNGNLSSSGTVSFTGPVFAGGGNRVLTVDNTGVLGATAMTSLPAGTNGYTLRYNGSNWVSNSLLYNNGTNIGVGTTNPGAPFSIVSSSDVDTFTLTNQALSANIGFVLRLPLSTGPNDGKAFGFYAGGESWTRGIFYSDGAYGIGPGNATRDVFLRRYSTNNLMIDSNKAGGAANLLVTGNLGLGTTNPGAYRLNVVGASNLGGNLTATGTVSFTGVVFAGGGNRMITVDNAGVLGAGALPVSLPTGTTSYTLRYDGSNWVSNGNIFNNGTNVGIGTTSPGTYRLSVDGTTRLNGAVTTSLSGSGNRCVYVDASGNLLAKGVDCGTATGGDNMGDHSATQNVKLNSYWLSGDGGNEGVFVNSAGRVGIGNSSPSYPLDVSGIIKTDNRIMIETGNGTLAMFMADEYGISEAGLYSGSGYRVATYNDFDSIYQYADGSIYASSGNIGLGTTNPGTYRLNVSGTSNLGGNLTTTGTVSLTGPVYSGGGNRMITVDNAGVLGAAALPTSLPSGTTSYTLRYDGSNWVSNGNIFNNGTNVGIGTTTPAQKFSVGNTTSDYIQSYGGFIGHPNANIGGTGDAAYFPEGIYSAKMNWLYGGINMNNGSLSGAGSGTFSGNVGIGTTNIATYRLNVIGTSNLGGNVTATGTVAFTGVVFAGGGNRMITVDNAGVLGAAAMPASLPSGTTGYTLRYDGSNWVSNGNIYNNGTNIGIGTTSPGAKLHVVGNAIISSSLTMGGDVNMGGNNITNLNKLTVNTIDPLYNIQGVNYSTFASAIVGGVKEEYVGTIKVARAVSGGGEEYEAVVNFDTLAKGSDLWVWRQVVDFSPENVQVNITPYGGFASAYYQIKGNKLIFRSDRPADLSYRLVGKRLDWRQWPTKALDQREEAGFQID